MYVDVLVETRVKSNNMVFTYKLPASLSSNIIGKRVLVPFSNRIVEGFVLNYGVKKDDYDVKEVIKVIDEEPILIFHLGLLVLMVNFVS